MRIGVLTSGGDAPGMNAAVRTVAVVGVGRGHEVLGVRGGYTGLLAGNMVPLTLEKVEGISRFGGTMLGSARSAVFPTDAGQAAARERVVELGLDALVVIGGNGSLTGAHRLSGHAPCAVVGIPASIDNDVGHSGLAIGVDTACNTIVEACDRIADTARAHRRAFVVEVMGRRCGFLAMRAGIAAEADAILYAERQPDEGELVARLGRQLARAFAPTSHKRRFLIMKAEGVSVPTERLVAALQEHIDDPASGVMDGVVEGVDVRATVLGHVVRGGRPSALDRAIAQRLAYAAVGCCEHRIGDVMVSWDVPGGFGKETPDPFVRIVPLADALEETERLLDGSSPVVAGRMALLDSVEELLAL